MKANYTLRVRGDVKCNRTLHDEFRHGTVSATPHYRVRQCASAPTVPCPPSPRHRIHSRFFGATSFLIWYVGGGLGRVIVEIKYMLKCSYEPNDYLIIR